MTCSEGGGVIPAVLFLGGLHSCEGGSSNPLRPISVIASEAKQSIPSVCREVDCFAEPVIRRRPAPTGWLAKTGGDICDKTLRSRDADRVRALLNFLSLERKREQGMPGARCTRGLVCNSAHRKRTRAYRYRRNTPAFPAQWLYGLCRALPGDEFVLPPSLAN